MKKQIFILEDDNAQQTKPAAATQQAEQSAQTEQPKENNSGESPQGKGGEQKDITPELKEVLNSAYNQLIHMDFFEKASDNKVKEEAMAYFKEELTKKIKTDYKHNEKYMQLALTELENILKSNPIKTDNKQEQSQQQGQSQQGQTPNEGEEDAWLSSKDAWLRSQRMKLNNWF